MAPTLLTPGRQRTEDVGQLDCLTVGLWDGKLRTGLAAMGCGMLLAFALLPAMRAILYVTTPHDPVSYIATTLFLGGTLLTVIFLSARSVVSIDPIKALRVE